VTCGGGEQRRYRTCETKPHGRYGKEINRCVGSDYSRRMCNTQCCAGKLLKFYVKFIFYKSLY